MTKRKALIASFAILMMAFGCALWQKDFTSGLLDLPPSTLSIGVTIDEVNQLDYAGSTELMFDEFTSGRECRGIDWVIIERVFFAPPKFPQSRLLYYEVLQMQENGELTDEDEVGRCFDLSLIRGDIRAVEKLLEQEAAGEPAIRWHQAPVEVYPTIPISVWSSDSCPIGAHS